MMAMWGRKLAQEVIVNSAQGSQYGIDNWKRICTANQLLPSMIRLGNCCDNPVAESFFSSLKNSVYESLFTNTRDLDRSDIFDYIVAFYNLTRRHTHLGCISPEAFENASN